MSVKPIPDGYHSVTPYLIIDGGDAAKAIEFYASALGAVERMRLQQPDGGIGHAEILIGDSTVMLADAAPDMGYRGPKALGGAPVSLMVYVDDCDRVFERAVAAGATVREGVQDKFYGDRSGQIEDPFGHVWTIATHVEDVPEDEMARRVEKFMQEAAGS